MDGDSLEVARRGWFSFLLKPKTFPVRLYAIDAPELSQPYGAEARARMREMARGSFRLEVVDTDRYGRVVGVVYRRNRKKSLNHMIVSSGFAYAYQRYGRLEGLADAEARARKRRLGIWESGGSQTRPWEHRRKTRAVKSEKTRRLGWRLRLVAAVGALVGVSLSLQLLWQSAMELSGLIPGG